jgi:hypothetical protein
MLLDMLLQSLQLMLLDMMLQAVLMAFFSGLSQHSRSFKLIDPLNSSDGKLEK